ncbi:uncharacterized protein LOC126890879 [Diabrotica virgifera virgifera]|uniref:DDE Tnp4 domain-containing protein n=1 Tax=Diabrotica virgifera virgifera TaxID=50390 RepID=A0ABM5L0K9_DIAVI|nr:uncharacterized protein LOC126890879 [Diabrotica virgifera virgifera]
MEDALDNVIRRGRGRNGIDHNLVRGIILNDIFVNPVVNPIQDPVLQFDLDNMEDKYVKLNFRFQREDLIRLAVALGIPEQIKTRSRHSSGGLEGLCILLRRLAYPSRLCDLEQLFRRSATSISEISNYVNNHIYRNHGYLLRDLGNLPWLNREKLSAYSNSIAAKGAAVQNCWGFIDGTARPICRPTELQEEYYSGHKRVHCLKYQSLICPDGIIVSLLGAYSGRRHDAFIFGQSGLYTQLERKCTFPDCIYVIYGDQAYGIRELLLCPYPGRGITEQQQNFNLSMSVTRQAVEWGFQKIISQFAFLDFKKNQKLLLQEVELMFKTAVLLCNCHTILYGSETAQFFNIEPVSLEDYLNL